jgi:hypothetical protein
MWDALQPCRVFAKKRGPPWLAGLLKALERATTASPTPRVQRPVLLTMPAAPHRMPFSAWAWFLYIKWDD